MNPETTYYLKRSGTSERITGRDEKPLICDTEEIAIQEAYRLSQVFGFSVEEVSLANYHGDYKATEQEAVRYATSPHAKAGRRALEILATMLDGDIAALLPPSLLGEMSALVTITGVQA